MKKVIIILSIIAIIVIANIIIVNVVNQNNNQTASTNTHVNTNVNNVENLNQGNQEAADNTDFSTVYFTSDISSRGLMNIYNSLQFEPQGNVAVKLSTGEAGGNYYLSPDLIKDLVQSVNGTIVECNTAYGGSRSNTVMHRQVAEDHGFTQIANVDILDENGSINLNVPNGKHLEYDMVGANYQNYDSTIVLSHFKGHAMAGFGGASQDDFLESMAEAALAIATDKGDNMFI